MIIAIDSQGNCKSVSTQSIYQGSVGVNEIILIAPFPSSSTVQIGLILPTGLYKFGDNGENYVPMTFVETNVDEAVNVWSYKLPLAITERQGEVEVSFRAPSPDLSEGLTTYLCKFTVSPSVVPELPDVPTDDVYADILAQLGQLNGRTAQVPTSVYKVTQTHPNAFTVMQNNGVESEIVIGNEDFPEGVNYDPAYATPALVINVDANGWTQNNNYFVCTVNAGSQLMGGATAQDLWVTFATDTNGKYEDFAPDYIISSDGMITITTTRAVAMVVKVWNGKSLVDEIANAKIDGLQSHMQSAEEDIEQLYGKTERSDFLISQLQSGLAVETERATGEELRLQAEIAELQNTGVDTTARDMVRDETRRATAAESELGQQINEVDAFSQDAKEDLQGKIDAANADIDQLYGKTERDELLIGQLQSEKLSANGGTIEGYLTVSENITAKEIYEKADDGSAVRVYSPNNPPPSVLPDASLSLTSTNPVQNKVVTEALNDKADTDGTYEDMSVGYASVAGSATTSGSATRLSTTRYIDGAGFNGATNITHYATCSTYSSTANKVVSTDEPILVGNGTRLAVKFSYENTASYPTLAVNGSSAGIYCHGVHVGIRWRANDTIEFLYSGGSWNIVGGYALDAYPVGSLYISIDATSPATLFGGDWAQIQDGSYLKAVTGVAGSYQQQGLPNITGLFSRDGDSYDTLGTAFGGYASGCFYGAGVYSSKISYGDSKVAHNGYSALGFSAQNSNSIYGASSDVTPYNYSVRMWRRMG